MPTPGLRIKCAEIFLTVDTLMQEYNCLFCHVLFDRYDAFADHFPACSRTCFASSWIASAEEAAATTNQSDGDDELYFDDSPKWAIKPEFDDPLEEGFQLESITLKIEETDPLPDDDQQHTPICDASPSHPFIVDAPESSSPSLLHNKTNKKKPISLSDTTCDENDAYTWLLLRQLRANHQTLQCDLCASELKTRCDVFRHMQRDHINKELVCNRCDASFTRHSDLRAHKRTHPADPYPCEMCGAIFTLASNLKDHLRVHTGEQPFECPVCARKFNHSSAMRFHVRVVHQGHRPHKCHVCDRAFTKQNLLAKHIDHVHLNVPVVKRFKCDLCPMSFKMAITRDHHRRTHTGERPFACDFCDRAFGRRGALRVHRNIHTGDAPHQCKYCERSFHSGAARRAHEKGVHKVK